MPIEPRINGLTRKQQEKLLEAFDSNEEYFLAFPLVGNKLVALNYAINASAMYNGVKYSYYKRYQLTDLGKAFAKRIKSNGPDGL